MKTALIDLDPITYIVAYRQWQSDNRDNDEAVRAHVNRFARTIERAVNCDSSLMFFQPIGGKNFRIELVPEYKSHRVTPDFIEHWRPVIHDQFTKLGAMAICFMESDDAISIMAKQLGYRDVTLICGDKDMKQIPAKQYNPFNHHLGAVDDPRRWNHPGHDAAERFLWQQIITGDPTDVPGEVCGVEGVGAKTAIKKMEYQGPPYAKVAQQMYSEKYGQEIGMKKAFATMQMVKLLVGGENYLPEDTKTEIEWLLRMYKEYIRAITDDVAGLFDKEDPAASLFK